MNKNQNKLYWTSNQTLYIFRLFIEEKDVEFLNKLLIDEKIICINLLYLNINPISVKFIFEILKDTNVTTLDLMRNPIDYISTNELAILLKGTNITDVIGASSRRLKNILNENKETKTNQLIALGQVIAFKEISYFPIFKIISFLHHGLITNEYHYGNMATELVVEAKTKAF